MKEIIDFSKQLIAIPSVAGDAVALRKVLRLALGQVRGLTVEHFERHGVRSALVYASRTRPSRFRALLNVHLDVIPAKSGQYIPRVKGKRLYGAGAMDMKANAAAAITAFAKVAPKAKAPLALQLVTDEEIGGFNGTKFQVERGVRADMVLATEPTNMDIVHMAKGVLWLKVTAKGIAAHGAYPWRGQNALLVIHQFITSLLRRYPRPSREVWRTTVNVSRIETTNTALNKIPDHASVWLDIRFIAEDTTSIVRTIRNLLPTGATLEIIAKEAALATPRNHPDVRLLARLATSFAAKPTVFRGAHGTSDARHFSATRAACIEFGPVGGGIGSDDEWVDIPSVHRYHDILRDFLSVLR
jgi:succinyl-diaminopimelate desuccinylase